MIVTAKQLSSQENIRLCSKSIRYRSRNCQPPANEQATAGLNTIVGPVFYVFSGGYIAAGMVSSPLTYD